MFFTTKWRFSLNSEEYLPSWFLDASRWRLVPKVHRHHLAGVSILLLEQKPELSLLYFVHTFSPLLHLLQFFPFSQSVSPSEDREDLNYHRASKKKMMPKCSFAHLKYRHTRMANSPSTTPAREMAGAKLRTSLQTLFFSVLVKGWVSMHLYQPFKKAPTGMTEAAFLVPPLDHSVLIYFLFLSKCEYLRWES